MGRYFVKRLGYLIVVALIISFLMFIIYNAVPFNRASTEAAAFIKANIKTISDPSMPEDVNNFFNCKYGYDGNLIIRYLRWVGFYPYTPCESRFVGSFTGGFNGMLQGNFGMSYDNNVSAIELMKIPMRNTIFINIFATILGLGCTIPLGIHCAVKKNGTFDKITQVFTIVGYSLPTFIFAILFIWFFAILIPAFPTGGMTTDATLTGAAAFFNTLYCLCLPIIVMTIGSLGGMTRYVRSAMIESLSMDCIRTARAKGLNEKIVIYSHAWRNALIPIVTLVIGWFLGIFSGSIVIEQLFILNGIGKLYIDRLNAKDYEVVLALQMFYVIISLLGNVLIDFVYGFIDPRVRVNK